MNSLVKITFEDSGRFKVEFDRERLLEVASNTAREVRGESARAVLMANFVAEEVRRGLAGILVAPEMLAEAAVTGSASRKIPIAGGLAADRDGAARQEGSDLE